MDILDSKCLIGGPRIVLKVRVAVLVCLQDILKVLVGMLLVVSVFCSRPSVSKLAVLDV